ncbi:hypothetical protein GWI33_018032 [Rhynchophorus ferrugineus]|uniref:Uncharacterized protein n=1 Tax=Rhynchophorus ferrugineus TaxID=354439 RepID=A0A834M6W5_RHYFE|nr:hypothetical protein GWI33_018032 [Rhynchophorus ferrugineus]
MCEERARPPAPPTLTNLFTSPKLQFCKVPQPLLQKPTIYINIRISRAVGDCTLDERRAKGRGAVDAGARGSSGNEGFGSPGSSEEQEDEEEVADVDISETNVVWKLPSKINNLGADSIACWR